LRRKTKLADTRIDLIGVLIPTAGHRFEQVPTAKLAVVIDIMLIFAGVH
jgi:hypothetical protein